jgi:hypothetical protein
VTALEIRDRDDQVHQSFEDPSAAELRRWTRSS